MKHREIVNTRLKAIEWIQRFAALVIRPLVSQNGKVSTSFRCENQSLNWRRLDTVSGNWEDAYRFLRPMQV